MVLYSPISRSDENRFVVSVFVDALISCFGSVRAHKPPSNTFVNNLFEPLFC